MRRKLICLLLCVLSLITVAFSGCGAAEETSAEDAEQKTARTPMSINMWIVSEEKVDSETERAVENAFNSLTQSKFTTKVDLIFLTEDEYFEKLEDSLNAAALHKLNSSSAPVIMPGVTTAVVEETTLETVTNELGQTLLKYPDFEEGQVDIIFLSGKQKLTEYIDQGWILSIEDKLNSSDAKVLKDAIYPSALERVKISNGQNSQAYSVPNNNVIGDYTYLLVNKEMADKYYIDLNKISSFADCADLINAIAEKETGIAPVLEYVNPVNMQYWLDFETVADNRPLTFKVGDVKANVFGLDKDMLLAPVDNNDTVMVPLKNFAEYFGADYIWQSATSTAKLNYGTRTITVTAGAENAVVNGENIALAVPAYIESVTKEGATKATDVVMVPAEFIVDSLCAVMEYDSDAQQYIVNHKDFGGISLLASYVDGSATLGDYAEMTSVFDIPEFTEHFILMEECKRNGWFAENPETAENYGVAILTGTYDDKALFEENGYEVKILTYPTLEDEDVYDSMFAISSYTVNVDRALEILTLIYTNTEAKNILQYGVEGTHFEFSDEGQFTVISDDYKMDNNVTGNAFLAYTEDEVSEDTWENAQKNNLPASVWNDEMSTNLESRVYPFFGLADAWTAAKTGVSKTHIQNVLKISRDMFDRMEDCETTEELRAFFEVALAELELSDDYQTAIGNESEKLDEEGNVLPPDETTPFVVYKTWGLANGWNKKEVKPAGSDKVEETTAVEETTVPEETTASGDEAIVDETTVIVDVSETAETTVEAVATEEEVPAEEENSVEDSAE